MDKSNLKSPVFDVIYGNLDFFPDALFTKARADNAKLFGQFAIKAIQSLVQWRSVFSRSNRP